MDFNAQRAPLGSAASTDAWRTRCDELSDVAIVVHYYTEDLNVNTIRAQTVDNRIPMQDVGPDGSINALC